MKSYREASEEFERKYFEEVMIEGGTIKAAAAIARKSITFVSRRVHRYGFPSTSVNAGTAPQPDSMSSKIKSFIVALPVGTQFSGSALRRMIALNLLPGLAQELSHMVQYGEYIRRISHGVYERIE